MKNKRNIIKFFVFAVAIISLLISYIVINPNSLLSYALRFKVLEPSYLDRKAGETLIDGFQSYSSLAQVKAAMPDHFVYEVAEKSVLDKGDTRPPFDFLSLSIKDYQHKGYAGELVLSFFNDRLMQCIFYPVDVEGFEKVLTKDLKMKVTKEDERKISGNVNLWHYIDYEGRPYFRWVDKRLEKENDAWIMRYS
ncbi:MAG: hypothetical protein KAJ07_05445 [Planctomycetes bacterium]|nr:hypothetical protein [Planctomycetota bacterium]